MGPSYGQYATRIYDSYLFHSVPYYSQHKDDVEYDEFNLLGTRRQPGLHPAGRGGREVDLRQLPAGHAGHDLQRRRRPRPDGQARHDLHRPRRRPRSAAGIPPTPTRPTRGTIAFESGTAIRSQAAWDQWETERENWMSSLTPTDLQGWSTDSKIAGTRG